MAAGDALPRPRHGLGTAFIIDGIVQPMELGHLGLPANAPSRTTSACADLKRIRQEEVAAFVFDVVAELAAALQPDEIVIGGGNVKQLTSLPPNAAQATTATRSPEVFGSGNRRTAINERPGRFSGASPPGRRQGRHGELARAGDRTSPSGNGAPSARTTAPTAPPGIICRTTTRAAGPTAGARTASPASATTSSGSASSLALWNGKDPILKERLFGLTNSEGNHGEDVKELYYYLDATPTHSYLKTLYKYPQRAFPYARLVEENRRRGRTTASSSCSTPGLFDEDRYFDVVVEYAKGDAGRDLMHITAHNRGPEAAALHLLPQLWFRNHWSLEAEHAEAAARRSTGRRSRSSTESLGAYRLRRRRHRRRCSSATTRPTCAGSSALTTRSGYFKDAFHDTWWTGVPTRSTRSGRAPRPRAHVPAARSRRRRGRVRLRAHAVGRAAATSVRAISTRCSTPPRARPTSSMPTLQRGITDADARLVQRQAFAGHDLEQAVLPLRRGASGSRATRCSRRRRPSASTAATGLAHLDNADVISMPDKWEYPWFAAWDLAFHCCLLAGSTRSSPSRSSSCCCASGTCTRTASSPPTSGRSATSIRPCTRGPPGASSRSTASPARAIRPTRAISPSWSASSRSCSQLHLVGEPQGRSTAATSSRAASSGSTTSASSTAAGRFPTGGTSSRPTARAGWRCTA